MPYEEREKNFAEPRLIIHRLNNLEDDEIILQELVRQMQPTIQECLHQTAWSNQVHPYKYILIIKE